jgi:hypothetical protein
MAKILRERAREVMAADLDAALPSHLHTPAIPFTPPETKLPALEGQPAEQPKRPRGRPKKHPLPEEPTNGEGNPPGWDSV